MTKGTKFGIGTPLRQLVAKNIRAAREHAGLSQRDMVSLTGIGQVYLSQGEDGRWHIGIDNIYKIACAIGPAPHDLVNPDFRADKLKNPGSPVKSEPQKSDPPES
jgi:transcriptional regulator with XRE-family HTH domain